MALIFGFVELVAGVLFLTSGITTASFAQILQGKAGQIYDQNQGSGGGPSTAGGAPTTAAGGTPNAAGQVNPVPGATGSRLDQGFDVTSKQFLAPFTGKIVASLTSDAGWAGGGFVAIANAADPKQVVYFAEGLIPIVNQGETVTAGQPIAQPALNPYNGIEGNIELGPANPSNPLQPLAQVASDPAAEVQKFYDWIRGLGGPAATSTALAGHA